MSGLAEWLRKTPQPAAVTVGQQRLVVPAGRKRWGQLVETIGATAKPGDKVVALDADGGVLRAVTYDGDGGVETIEETAKAPQGESEIVTFARILADSNDRAVARYETMFSTVFAAQNNMLATFANRLSGLENAWHRQVIESGKAQAMIHQLIGERDAAGADDTAGQMVSGVLAKMLTGGGGEHAEATNGATNGVANGAPKKGKK